MILLDDSQSTVSNPTSRLYQDPIQHWCIYPSAQPEENEAAIEQVFKELAQASARGEYLVTALAYELGLHFQGLKPPLRDHPLIEAWSFKNYEALSKPAVDQFLAACISQLPENETFAGVADLNTSIDFEQFSSDLNQIREWILAGDVYQINHTYRLGGQVYGSPLALYSRLRKRQPGRFGAFIQSPGRSILSHSPELFIQRNGDTLTAMPMKGTASALNSNGTELSEDPKNQAENVMIVDLLRNDLGRIAQTGSVKVSKLFEVARHGDVLQMTSTVEAQLKRGAEFLDILRAVFPCGSVTGAPKKRSMEIIQGLEPSRDYYCGAIGWLDPDHRFALSVPIRTLEIDHANYNHASLTMGVGAGITIESKPDAEWQECAIKSVFLTELPSSVGLFETILIKHGEVQLIESHLDRLAHSAQYLGIPFDRPVAKNYILQAWRDFSLGSNPSSQYRLRVDLSPIGKLTHSTSELSPLSESVKLFWAKDILADPAYSVMQSQDCLLQHKSHSRTWYDRAWRLAETHGGFDALFTNEAGFVTEGGRSSIFIRKPNMTEWLTPPLTAGLLPGVMRAQILGDPSWNAREANLTIEDVLMADKIVITNALRGAVPAHL
jgi:para-aminobenzoate synthetase/4-amino-4-deoxychorismate lyase